MTPIPSSLRLDNITRPSFFPLFLPRRVTSLQKRACCAFQHRVFTGILWLNGIFLQLWFKKRGVKTCGSLGCDDFKKK